MHYFIDSEFIERGSTYPLDLISIGIVASDGREFYGQSVEFDLRNGNDWVWDNVYPHLEVCPYKPSELDRAFCCKHKQGKCTIIPEGEPYNRCPWRTREQLKRDILTFLNPKRYGKPELLGWCAAYDMIAFCQLFGTMMDLPQGYPHHICDFQCLLDARGITDDMLPQQEVACHHALADARWIRHLWQMLEEGSL